MGNKDLKLLNGTIICLALALALFLLMPVLPVLLLALLLYVALEPLTNRLCRRGFNRSQASAIVIGSLTLLLALGLWLGSATIAEQVQTVYHQLGKIQQQLAEQIDPLNHYLTTGGLNIDLSPLKQFVNPSSFNLDIKSLQSGSTLLLSLASYLLLLPLITFFLLKDFRSIRNKALGLLPNRFFELGWLIYYRVSCQLQRYFIGLIVQAMILSLIAALGFYLIGLPSFLVFGLLTGLLAIIPYLGIFLAILIPGLVIWSTSPGDYLMLMKIVLVVALAHLHDQLVVVPTIIANAVNLHALVIIFGIVLFGYYLGIFGMIIAVPALAAIKIILESLMNGLQNRG